MLDVRPVEGFAAGHVAGALNVPLAGSGFGTTAGFVLRPEEPIAIHAVTVHDALAAAERLHAVSFLDLAGYLSHPPLPATMPLFADLDAVEHVLHSTGALLVDVRDEHESRAARCRGASTSRAGYCATVPAICRPTASSSPSARAAPGQVSRAASSSLPDSTRDRWSRAASRGG